MLTKVFAGYYSVCTLQQEVTVESTTLYDIQTGCTQSFATFFFKYASTFPEQDAVSQLEINHSQMKSWNMLVSNVRNSSRHIHVHLETRGCHSIKWSFLIKWKFQITSDASLKPVMLPQNIIDSDKRDCIALKILMIVAGKLERIVHTD